MTILDLKDAYLSVQLRSTRSLVRIKFQLYNFSGETNVTPFKTSIWLKYCSESFHQTFKTGSSVLYLHKLNGPLSMWSILSSYAHVTRGTLAIAVTLLEDLGSGKFVFNPWVVLLYMGSIGTCMCHGIGLCLWGSGSLLSPVCILFLVWCLGHVVPKYIKKIAVCKCPAKWKTKCS